MRYPAIYATKCCSETGGADIAAVIDSIASLLFDAFWCFFSIFYIIITFEKSSIQCTSNV